MVTEPENQHHAVVVIPTYNERENLPLVCQQVLQATDGQVHILVVDDNSPDGTGQIADELATQHPQIHVMHRERKEGLGRAYVAGFKQALDMGYQLIAQMDADLSHDPKDLPRLLEAAVSADLIIGSRYVPGGDVSNWSRQRFWLSFFANQYVRWITHLPVRDATGGYRCWRRQVLEAINLDTIRSNGYAFQIEMAYRAYRHGFHLQEIPIVFTERRAGKS
ncbi:MAG: dolichyl-phosphate beta-D-mannosyltransferase [Armatimonadota bacterium]|nr:MAG: dolichyl-phosphate beta-D-mannosyltransferase [Armatimonadota bacterium]